MAEKLDASGLKQMAEYDSASHDASETNHTCKVTSLDEDLIDDNNHLISDRSLDKSLPHSLSLYSPLTL